MIDYIIDRFNNAINCRFGCSLYLIATIKVSSKFGVLKERFYI
jgi:hypothetical protein